MAEIKYSDLFDGDINDKIATTQKLIKGLEEDIRSLLGLIQKQNVIFPSKEALKALEQYNRAVANGFAPIKETAQNLSAAETAQKKYNQSVTDAASFIRINNDSLEAQKANLKALKAEYSLLTKEEKLNKKGIDALTKDIQELNGTIKQQQKVLRQSRTNTKEVIGDYNRLSIELAEARQELSKFPGAINKVTGEWDLNNKKVAQQIKNIQTLDGQLKRLDNVVGVNTRNVGDYSRAFTGLQTSTNQLSRELPALGISTQTFFLAISNNVPIFLDSIKALRVENAKLAGLGEKQIPVWKSLTRAIFSWQTVISLSVTALVLFGKEIGDFLGKLFKTEKAFDATAEVGKAAADSIGSATAEFQALRSIVDDSSASVEENNKAVGLLVDQYPDLETTVDSSTGKLKLLQEQLDLTSESLLNNSIAAAALSEAGAIGTELYNLKLEENAILQGRTAEEVRKALEADKERFKQIKGIPTVFGSSVTPLSTYQFQVSKLNEIEEERTILLDKLKEINAVYREAFVKVIDTTKDATTGQEDYNDELILTEDLLRRLADLQFQLATDAEVAAALQEAGLEDSVNILNRLIEAEEQIQDATLKRTDINADQKFQIIAASERRIFGFKQQIIQAEKDAEKRKFDEILQQQKDVQREQERLAREADKAIRKEEEKKRERERESIARTKRTANTVSDIIGGALEGANAIFEIASNQRQAIFEAEIEALIAARDRELQNAGDNEEAKERIQQKFAQKEKELRRQQAEGERQAALLKVAVETAAAVATALATAFVLQSNPLTASLAPAAFASAAAAAASGAAQAAVIASAPLPQFEEGGVMLASGKAQVSEKGPELRVSKSGDVSLTPEKKSIVHLDKGDSIIPAHQTAKILSDAERNLYQMVNGERIIRMSGIAFDQVSPEQMKSAVASAVKDGIAGQTLVVNEVNERGFQTYLKRKGRKTEFLNKRYA